MLLGAISSALVPAPYAQGAPGARIASPSAPQSASPSEGLSKDFNLDGYADLVIGAPAEDVDSVLDAGSVTIYWGYEDGLHPTGNLQITEAMLGLPVQPDSFGSSLTSGDFNEDGYSDLAVGASNYTDQGVADAGAVFVMWGTPSGLGPAYQLLTQSDAGITPQSEAGFGFSLSVSNWGWDNASDLAVGMPTDDVHGISDSGQVLIYEGHSLGVLTVGQILTGATPKHPPAAGDEFGYSLRGGHFNGTISADGYRAIAIGVPYKDIGTQPDAGAVVVLYGTATGFPRKTQQFWSENSLGINGEAGAGDRFGFSVATRYITPEYCDLVVGVPFKSTASIEGGAINVIYGSPEGLTSEGNQYIDMESSGVARTAAPYDHFGFDVSVRDLGFGKPDDVAIGTPGANGVVVLYGKHLKLGKDHATWLEDSTDGAFGLTVSIWKIGGEPHDALVVGTPFKTVDGLENAGGFFVAYSLSSGGFGQMVSYDEETPQAGAAFGSVTS